MIIKTILIPAFFMIIVVIPVVKKITDNFREKKYMQEIRKNRSIEALKNLGFLYLKQKRYKESERCFEIAAEEEDTGAFSGLGALYIILKDYGKAEDCFMKALEKGCASAMYNLGALYYIQRNYEKSEKYYKMALENGYEKAGKMLVKLQKKH
ncbi:tetratricopeptide repeat protein [Sebaldella sp. S0638]|uniref:tetratricopeptide repeat protein n=1 Tax=Sebaldella sp. S0638 TaxID=2957809 RepID=UPI0020A0EFF6|nr:tetratricopeptide repeat protein [Sebaldella sp. S0638]MCP1223751.1 tetratricopeptide repeat protein [Sebaldella sp. S0638]